MKIRGPHEAATVLCAAAIFLSFPLPAGMAATAEDGPLSVVLNVPSSDVTLDISRSANADYPVTTATLLDVQCLTAYTSGLGCSSALNGFSLDRSQTTSIRAFSLPCRKITVLNLIPGAASIFIPMQHAGEWTSFINAGAPGMSTVYRVDACATMIPICVGNFKIDPANAANDQDCSLSGKVCSGGACVSSCSSTCDSLTAVVPPANSTPISTPCSTVTSGSCDSSKVTGFTCNAGFFGSDCLPNCGIDCADGVSIPANATGNVVSCSVGGTGACTASIATSWTCNEDFHLNAANDGCEPDNPSTTCPAATIGRCQMEETPFDGQDGSCIFGFTGTCSYKCNNTGTWSMVSNMCVPDVSCPATALSGCTLDTTMSGGSDGTCASGVGACDYSCNSSGSWTVVSNTCCQETTWTPAASSICSGDTFTQTSNCGTTRAATGTEAVTWGVPLPSAVCSGVNFLQWSFCGGGDSRSRAQTGTKTCVVPTCYKWYCHLSKWTKQTTCAGPCPVNAENRIHSQEYVCISGDPGAPCQDPCFIAGTKILMADGTSKPIQKVRKGDRVQGLDVSNVVLETIVHEHDGWLYSINGGKYFVTDAHPFMTKGGIWKAFDPEAAKRENPQLDIQELKVGDVLVARQSIIPVTKIDRVKKKKKVYNFVVDNTHHYYADGYLVHNKWACDAMTLCPDPEYECIGGTCH